MKKGLKTTSIIVVVVSLLVIIPNIVNAASGVTKSVDNCTYRTNHYIFNFPRGINSFNNNEATRRSDEVDFYHDSGMDDDWQIVSQGPVDRLSFDKNTFADITEEFSKVQGSGGSAPNYVQRGQDYYFMHGSCNGYCFQDDIYEVFRKLSGQNLTNLKRDFANALFIPTADSVVLAKSYTMSGTTPTNVKKMDRESLVHSGKVNFMYYRSWDSLGKGDLKLNLNKYMQLASMQLDSPGYGNSAGGSCPDNVTDGSDKDDNNKSCEAYVAVDYVVELKKCSYIISYDGGANNAKNVPDSQSKESGDCVDLSSKTPTRDGYTFQYWVDTDNNRYDPSDNYCIDENLDLTAVWKENSSGNIVTPSDDGKNSENDVQSPGTGVGVAYGLIATVIIGSTIAIVYVRRRNKFENI